MLGDSLGDGDVLGDVGGAETLGDLPGDMHLLVGVIGGDRSGEASLLTVSEVFGAGAEDVADAVERVALAAPMPEGLLLDPAADLVERSSAQLDHVERVEHGDGVFEVLVDGVAVSTRGSNE